MRSRVLVENVGDGVSDEGDAHDVTERDRQSGGRVAAPRSSRGLANSNTRILRLEISSRRLGGREARELE